MRRTSGQNGQVLPVLLAVISIAIAALLMSHRTGRAIGQESTLVNAADAAAYSAGNWAARQLNLMAYTNRAMVANHIAVGHLVAYISWLRYAEDASDQIARYSAYLPYVGAATRSANDLLRGVLTASERASWGYINTVDALHGLMTLSQLQARRALAPDVMASVMRRVAHTYDEDFKVNRGGELTAIPAPYKNALQATLGAYRVAMLARVKTDKPGTDQGYFNRIVSRTIKHDRNLSRWIQGRQTNAGPRFGTGGRNWSRSIFSLIRFRKQGPTNLAPRPDAGGWRSADRLQVGLFDFDKFEWGNWRTLASGRASADQLAGNYDGIDRYTRAPKRLQDKGQFTIPAMLTSAIPGQSSAAINAHLSVAKVIYEIPRGCAYRCPKRSAKATLFNPYWRASLDAPRLPRVP